LPNIPIILSTSMCGGGESVLRVLVNGCVSGGRVCPLRVGAWMWSVRLLSVFQLCVVCVREREEFESGCVCVREGEIV